MAMARKVKKYKNRQMYDVANNESITLGQMARGIQRGEVFKVIDNDTAADITLQTYSQALCEEIKAGRRLKDYDEIIRQITLRGGEKTMGVLRKTVLAGIGAVNLTRQKAAAIVDDLVRKGELSEGQKAVAVKELMNKASVKAKSIGQVVDEKVKRALLRLREPHSREVGALKRELTELKAKLKDLEEKLK
jgi:polyhydroxyalkanoate synthesis regulator phasin